VFARIGRIMLTTRGIPGRVIGVEEFVVAASANRQWQKERIFLAPCIRLTFRARQAASLTSPKGKVIKKPKERPVENGIQAFFGKADTTVRQKKEGVSKSPVASNTGSIRLLATVANPIGENKPKKPVLKLPETPSFQPVRAAGTDLEFSDCLKIREFVLTCTSPTCD
jgi:hypothetical protein